MKTNEGKAQFFLDGRIGPNRFPLVLRTLDFGENIVGLKRVEITLQKNSLLIDLSDCSSFRLLKAGDLILMYKDDGVV